MNIDKRNGNVAFNGDKHVYWDVTNNKRFISVTTLINRYCVPFEQEFWSGFKALEKIMSKNEWRLEKPSLLKTKKISKDLLDAHNISEDEFNKVQQAILDEWADSARESCERGTRIHAEIEESFYANPKNITMDKFGVGGKFECKKDYHELDLEYGVYPEYLIYRESADGVLRIAGQIDLLIKSGNDVVCVDHKTNRKIDTKPAYDSNTKSNVMMLYPLNNLPDTNFYHYSMQLSTYAWMLQKINPDFNIKRLILNHYDHEGNNVLYDCNYLKAEVERMLYHYKKSLLIEQSRERRKKIEY